MSDIYSVSVHDGRDITTILCKSLAEAEAVLRDNYDQEPADYADLNLDDLIEALERRDGLTIEVGAHSTEPFIPSHQAAVVSAALADFNKRKL